jgi:ferredoxin-type protein NapH
MDRIKNYLSRGSVSRLRFYFQIGAFLVLIYGGYLALDLSNSLPAFACAFVDSRSGLCYLYPIQHGFNLAWNQFIGPRGIALLSGLVAFFVLFAFLNKAWCGFACPLGTIQDWIANLRKKFGVRYATYNEGSFRRLKSIKYILLALVIVIPLGIGNSFFGLPKFSHDLGTAYCMICPARTILPLSVGDASQLSVNFSSATTTIATGLGMAVTGLFLTGSFIKKRFFCLFCPMSALQFAFSRMSLLRLTKNGGKCTRCGNCYRVCDMGISGIADDVTSKFIVKDDCMMCFKCVEACPEEKCLTVSLPGLPLYESTEEGFAKRMKRRDDHG